MDSTSKITKRHFQLITTTTICVGLLLLGCNSQKNTSDKKSTPLVKTEDVVATPSSELNPQEKISNSPSAEPAIDLQTFVMRSDLACGSTIGPITATETGIPTTDIGIPTLAMHSIRELACAGDIPPLVALLNAFYRRVA